MTLNSRSAKLSSPNVKVQDVPNKPTIGTPTQNLNDVSIPFTPASTGGRAAIYRAVSSPDGIEAISYGSSPITIPSGLTSGTAYTFSVRGESATGATTGYSSASAPLTPSFSDMELITTTTITANGVTGGSFTNIPQTYKHLQMRAVFNANTSNNNNYGLFFATSDSTTDNAMHILEGNNTYGLYSESRYNTYSGSPYISFPYSDIHSGAYVNPSSNQTEFVVAIVDLLDYTSNSKNKTYRNFSGYLNSSGRATVTISSLVHTDTTPVSLIHFWMNNGPQFTIGSRFSLYGIKG